MDRTEALTGILVAAEQLLRTVDLPRDLGTPSVPVPIGVLVQLASAVGAVGEAEAAPSPGRADGLCTTPDCWRRGDTADGTCFAHSPLAAAPQVRRRDRLFTGGADG